ncbi:MAG: helix-turn-helix domain-containing protein [Bacteroidales bacterium]|nr:helix-turn-helix domain-containing protein [Bacteroidales bacterium]
MAKTINITIKESEANLKYLLRQQTKLLQQGRIKALLLIKQGKVTYTHELASKLKRERKTIYNWLKLYQEKGIEAYLTVSSRGKRNEKLSQEDKQALTAKLQDPNTDITSYVELRHWINLKSGKDIPYYVLYHYCHTHLQSKLKVARKSHHKKDEQAIEAFKKTTRYNK